MEAIEKLAYTNHGDEVSIHPSQAIDKINELVDRVNQLVKPLLIARVSGAALRRWEGDPQPLIDKMRADIKETVNNEYHVLCVIDDFAGAGITFEVHNQQTEIAKTLIIQLENFKMPKENGEQ